MRRKTKKVGMKRIIINWVEKTSDGFKGVVTLDKFEDNNVMSILETFTCACEVTKNSVGMSGIGDGVIVPLTEQEREQVNELMRWYWSGRNNEKSTYSWFTKEGR